MAMSFTNLVVLAFLLILTMELYFVCFIPRKCGIKPREYIFSVNKFCYKIEFIKHHEIDGDGFFLVL